MLDLDAKLEHAWNLTPAIHVDSDAWFDNQAQMKGVCKPLVQAVANFLDHKKPHLIAAYPGTGVTTMIEGLIRAVENVPLQHNVQLRRCTRFADVQHLMRKKGPSAPHYVVFLELKKLPAQIHSTMENLRAVLMEHRLTLIAFARPEHAKRLQTPHVSWQYVPEPVIHPATNIEHQHKVVRTVAANIFGASIDPEDFCAFFDSLPDHFWTVNGFSKVQTLLLKYANEATARGIRSLDEDLFEECIEAWTNESIQAEGTALSDSAKRLLPIIHQCLGPNREMTTKEITGYVAPIAQVSESLVYQRLKELADAKMLDYQVKHTEKQGRRSVWSFPSDADFNAYTNIW